MADLETLTLQINAQTQNALTAIGKLSQRLNTLSVSIAKLETGKLDSLAAVLGNLNNVIAGMSATKKWDYNRIASSITALTTINTNGLDVLSASLTNLGNSFSNMAGAAASVESVKGLVQTIGRFGGKSVQNAITNLPKLEKELTHLIKAIAKLPDVKQSIIDFTNALAGLTSQGSRVGTASNSIKRSLNAYSTTATRAARSSRTLASAIGLIYARFWLLMRAVNGLKKAFTSAADYLEAYNFFDVVAGKIGSDTFNKAGVGDADEYAKAFTDEMQRKLHQMSGLELDLEDKIIKTTNAKSLGLNITELTQYQASIASITNAMGQAQEVSTATAKAFSMLAADMSSLRNMDYEEVAKKLQSSLTGQARALYAFGIDITQATLEQYAYANGVSKSVSEMTQAEKAQLRLLAILDQSKVAWGDLANTINSPSNQLRQLKNNFAELGTVLGQLFIPMMSNLLPKLNGLSIALKQLLVDIAGILGIQLNLDEFGKGFSDTIDEDTESLDDLNQTMKETKKGIRDFDELKVIGDTKNKSNNAFGDQIDLTQQILDATAEYEKVWDEAYARMKSKAQEIANAISGALDPIRNIVKDFHVGDFFQAGKDVSHLVTSIFNYFSDAIEQVDWVAIGHKIGDFIDGIDWFDILKSIANLIWQAIQAAVKTWSGSFDVAPFETAIITAFALLKFTSLGHTLTENIKRSITTWFAENGVDKAFLMKAGLGVVAAGLSVSFFIDNVTDIQVGKYAALSAQSLAKAAISSLLMGAGFTAVVSAMGGGHLGIVFAVTTGLTLLINIIAAELNEPEPNVERELAEQQYAWVEQEHLDTIDVLTNINLRMGNLNEDEINLDFLGEQVLTLSENYDTLSDSSKELLKVYSEELVGIMPELADSIDEVTGAYKGTREELDKLIEREKAHIETQALEQNLTDIAKRQWELKPEYERIVKEQQDARAAYDEAVRSLESYGFTSSQIKDMQDGTFDTTKILNPLASSYAKKLKQLYENLNAANQASSQITEDWNNLSTQYNYYMDAYEEAIKTTAEETKEELEKSQKENAKIINSPKLPNAIESTMNKIDKKIAEGETVTKNDMNQMFNGINNSFAGLGDGKVPAEVQATMDNIEYAILTGSPKLISYMGTLKKQMEEAFVNAHYDNNGEMIWNVNDISERLDKDVKNITEGVDRGAKPILTSLENDLKELFGGELPEEVNNALVSVADTINNGKGKTAIVSAMDELIKITTKKADDLGMNLCWGAIGGIYSGTNQIPGAIDYMVDKGMVEPYQTKTETNSPSRLFRRLATNIPEGVALGIEDDTPDVVKAMNVLVRNMQSAFAGYQFNIPSLNLGNSNRTQYGSANPYANTGNSLYENMNNANGYVSAPQEVVFRVEGDPYNIFKVVRDQNDSFRRRTHRSAFT